MNSISMPENISKLPADKKVNRWLTWFIISVGLIFLITGLAKIISFFGNANMLDLNDPIFGIRFRCLILFVGVLELATSAVCLLTSKHLLCLFLAAWLSTSFILYRMGAIWVGYHRPCACLGSLTIQLHISERNADLVMKLLAAYIFVGSLCFLTSFLKRLN
jgi:hypothetical protein